MSATTRSKSASVSGDSFVKDALLQQAAHRELLTELSELLLLEGWLLDNDRLEDWLGLMADDVRYVAPVRRKIVGERLDLASLDDGTLHVGHFNDGKTELGFRIARMRTGFDHYNRPSALSRRIIGAIRLLGYDHAVGTVSVTSNFMLFRAREEKEETLIVGCRDDVWRRSEGGWRLHRRMIKFDHYTVPPLSQLF